MTARVSLQLGRGQLQLAQLLLTIKQKAEGERSEPPLARFRDAQRVRKTRQTRPTHQPKWHFTTACFTSEQTCMLNDVLSFILT
ncbi:hypothetical protein J4Q44_G00218780 [Coregonus suidteri]|uniref:Uncharacterized protein n=1 Tax=Coregonus suidteri TaxID=861788 RepID=A0AAN8LHH2_9TELE